VIDSDAERYVAEPPKFSRAGGLRGPQGEAARAGLAGAHGGGHVEAEGQCS
jgi:hypothetical protein